LISDHSHHVRWDRVLRPVLAAIQTYITLSHPHRAHNERLWAAHAVDAGDGKD